MPAKARISRQQIIDCAADIIREQSLSAVNARNVARQLHCSTQPVLYYFATMEELKQAVYDHINQFHTAYLLNVSDEDNALLQIGLNYIRFAVEYPNWFQFIFNADYGHKVSLEDIISAPEQTPFIKAIVNETGIDEQKARDIFLILAMFVHGYASIISTDSLKYDEETVARHLEMTFNGALAAALKGE